MKMDPTAAEKWRQNLKILPREDLPTRNAFVCRRHFEESAVGVKRLRYDAVSTLYLGYDEPPQHSWTSNLRMVALQIRNAVYSAFRKVKMAAISGLWLVISQCPLIEHSSFANNILGQILLVILDCVIGVSN